MRAPRCLRWSCLFWLLAVMAVLGQVVGAAAMPEAVETAPLGIICSADAVAPGHPPAHHHHHDCAVCPFCAAMAVHAALLSPAPLLPAPMAGAIVAPGLPPPARAPPPWQFESPYPRGPPAFA